MHRHTLLIAKPLNVSLVTIASGAQYEWNGPWFWYLHAGQLYCPDSRDTLRGPVINWCPNGRLLAVNREPTPASIVCLTGRRQGARSYSCHHQVVSELPETNALCLDRCELWSVTKMSPLITVDRLVVKDSAVLWRYEQTGHRILLVLSGTGRIIIGGLDEPVCVGDYLRITTEEDINVIEARDLTLIDIAILS
ncbi:hypothetical protein HY523_01655 [Candidatus Berkelbacteria bacterium]|nr:hypothetical protein [Candidatus Berkelbacteria bacterium]